LRSLMIWEIIFTSRYLNLLDQHGEPTRWHTSPVIPPRAIWTQTEEVTMCTLSSSNTLVIKHALEKPSTARALGVLFELWRFYGTGTSCTLIFCSITSTRVSLLNCLRIRLCIETKPMTPKPCHSCGQPPPLGAFRKNSNDFTIVACDVLYT
jgi:hypothetical protein